MSKKKDFDLSELLGDSLSLQCNIAAPARYITKPKVEDYYKKLAQMDPYELLGERDFGTKERVEIPTNTPIQEFFRGANIFITGGTGFVGKLLTEKLVRCVPHIGHIYLLIRAKKGKTCEERFQQLLEDKVFRRMKAEVPDYATKLTAVDGDIVIPDLGLSPTDRRLLTDRVNVVFHSAADVRFLEPLRNAVGSNVLGSRRVLQLAKEMKDLWSFIHVSTAFSHCVQRVIEEDVPRLNLYHKELLNYIESKTDEELKEKTTRLLQGWPNTYTFSKALCEEMIAEEAKDLPACIFRPSIVTPTYREPVRGYIDNVYGPTGLLLGAGHGVLHCFYMKGDFSINTVPVDYLANCMIAAAWKTAREKRQTNDPVPVYNFTGPVPGVCWKYVVEDSLKQKDIFPFSRAFWYTSFFYTENYYVNEFVWYLLHKIPGTCLDKLAELTGGSAILTKIYQRIEKFKETTDYFLFREWIFKSDNVQDLWRSMAEDDKKVFYFDVNEVDFKEHLVVSKLGVRYYYLKEKMENIPAAVQKNTKLYWLHNSAKLIFSVLALKLLVVSANALPF